jgi:hypothetical protein
MAREMKVCTITISNDVAPTSSNPLTLIGVEKTPTPCVKKPKTAKTFSQKSAEIFWSVGDDSIKTIWVALPQTRGRGVLIFRRIIHGTRRDRPGHKSSYVGIDTRV